MEIIAIQSDIAWEDRETNFARVRALLSQVRIAAGSLLVLPELFATGFSMEPRKAGDSIARESEKFLADLARQYQCCLIGGVARREKEQAANEAIAFGPDGNCLHRYRKLHPFTLAGEAEHYPAGREIGAFSWGGFRIAPVICYDLRFPEVFRAALEADADFFVVIANWPSVRMDHWTTLLRARAIENLAYVVGINRTGSDPANSYSGRSLIVDSQGKVLAEGGAQPTLVRAEADPRLVADWRAAFPALRDRRDEIVINMEDDPA
ncbi:MAG: carbon-nitrogen family hydrolase [Verrucomicrobiales bacterium]|nr:carbon-nitrogen family hydrolase [Verrucomicrobiales bacterium]